jgi:hypothetical protein
MIDLVAEMPEPLRRSAMVREQLGFALNRAGKGDTAETVLLDLIAERGPSSEMDLRQFERRRDVQGIDFVGGG